VRGAWGLGLVACAIAQPTLSDSLQRLFERDFAFDVVVVRTFPVQTVLTDTFPLVSLLSGPVRVGLAWHFRQGKGWAFTLQAGGVWGRYVLRATRASVVPYAEKMPENYRWLKYRWGGLYLQGALRWERLQKGDLFPRFWIEAGGWLQRQIGSSLKYVAQREGYTERVRWEGIQVFLPWQGGVYAMVGRQWIGASVYYHLAPVFRRGIYAGSGHPYPTAPPWEVGFVLAL